MASAFNRTFSISLTSVSRSSSDRPSSACFSTSRTIGTSSAIAFLPLGVIRKSIERRSVGSSCRHKARATDSVSTLQTLKAWLDKTQPQVPPTNALGKAIAYTLKYWPELTQYTNNGAWPIDNNLAENAIRPFVIGRKAWLFSNSQRGATASANLYSLIETAKANDREPYQYLSWLFERLPTTEADDYEKLMPWNMLLAQDL